MTVEAFQPGLSVGVAAERLPRLFQANIDRFYRRVISPGLEQFSVQFDAPEDGDAFDRLAAEVNQHTGREVRRSNALALAGLFERQVRTWAREGLPDKDARHIAAAPLALLVEELATARALDLHTRGDASVLRELILVANVVRHGDGPSCDALRRHAPALRQGFETEALGVAENLHRLSEFVEIGNSDLRRYGIASARFWGLADKLLLAVNDPSY